MFKSIAHTVLALAMLVTAEASYDGPGIKYNIYGAGVAPCNESNIAFIGETTKLFQFETKLEEDALCEHDIIDGPNGPATVYTKLQRIECKSDVMEVEAYNCFDDACMNCSKSMEFDAFVTTRNIQDVLEDPFGCFEMVNATENRTAVDGDISEFFNIDTMSAQRFLTSGDKNDIEEYWNYFFGTACGDEWLATVKDSHVPSQFGNHGSQILVSVLAAVAMAVAVVA
mmetsp:Transcript_35416/g.40274  ORF Transcript_35416/g.40274 Transcript_35416/m.40274 type:complete len:227 (-) Transcript_35416:365-1045(-)